MLTRREFATTVAALRLWQQLQREGVAFAHDLPNVSDETPLSIDESDTRCDCELPGTFCSGVPGILACLEQGRLAPGAAVERCDACCRFDSDAAALGRLIELDLA